MLQDKLCHRTQALNFHVCVPKWTTHVDHRNTAMKILNHSKAKNGPCLFLNMTLLAFHSCIQTFLNRTCWSEVNDLINGGVHLAKEAAGIDQQKKQFQRTGQDSVEVMNDMFSIGIWKMCSIYFHRYHSQTMWVENFKSYIFYDPR